MLSVFEYEQNNTLHRLLNSIQYLGEAAIVPAGKVAGSDAVLPGHGHRVNLVSRPY